MSVLELVAYLLKIVSTVLDLHSQNSLSRDQLDAAVAALKNVPPYGG